MEGGSEGGMQGGRLFGNLLQIDRLTQKVWIVLDTGSCHLRVTIPLPQQLQ